MLLFFVICGILLILIIIYSLIENKFLKISNYSLESLKVTPDLMAKRILFLSDLHGYRFGKDNSRLITRLQSLKPDFILIAGDFITKNKPGTMEATKHLMKDLCKICTVFYSLGNHESTAAFRYPEKYAQFLESIKKSGVIYLDNQSVFYHADGSVSLTYDRKAEENTGLAEDDNASGKVTSAGLKSPVSGNADKLSPVVCKITGLTLGEEYYDQHPAVLTKDLMNELIGEADTENYHILLAHNPECFSAYADWQADLSLGGHYHGGIIRIPGLGGLISPKYRLFPDYTSGAYKKGNTTMLVSKGLGTHTIHFRLFNRPEINILHFSNGKEISDADSI